MASKVADQSQEFEDFRRRVATERGGESAALQAVEEQLSEQNGTIAHLNYVVSRLEDDITSKNRTLDEALQRLAHEETERENALDQRVNLETRLSEQDARVNALEEGV